MSATHFRELDVWKLAMELTQAVYQLAASFPREERYGLAMQLQRSAVSIPSNIAEGNARSSTKDYARFVSIAAGSNAELTTQLLLAQMLGLASAERIQSSLAMSERVGQMLLRLNQSLSRRIETESRVPSPESRS